jgi:hypothetical protein
MANFIRKSRMLFLALACAGCLCAEPPPEESRETELLQKYFASIGSNQEKTRGVQMETEFIASVPRLGKKGAMKIVRYVVRTGQVLYGSMLHFEGDSMVKKDVIARFMTAEIENSAKPQSIGLTDVNYKFKPKKLEDCNGRPCQLYQLEPRRKEVGLFKGELWLDVETGLPLREKGRFVKNPHVSFKKAEFVRYYKIEDGIARVVELESRANLWVVGKVDMHIHYGPATPAEGPPSEEKSEETPAPPAALR